MKSVSLRIVLVSLLFLLAVPGTVVGLVPYWLSGWEADTSMLDSDWIAVLGIAALLAGLCGLLQSVVHFARDGQGTPAPAAPPKCLVVSGCYRHVRNPMYLSVLLAIAGQGLFLGSGHILAYAGGLWLLFHLALVFHEEPCLARRFGESYRTYCRQVGRWWPTPWNRHAR
jgi:protein-S-isoprenylcysteine O-methyltransferase Ste14